MTFFSSHHLKKIAGLLLFFILTNLSGEASAQATLSEDEVVQVAKKNNYDVRISNNAYQVSSLNFNAAKGAMYPMLNGSFNDEFQWLQLHQKTNSGENIIESDVLSQTLGADVTASALLYNGNHLVSIKNRLFEQMQQSKEQYNAQVQTTTLAVLSKYYEIVHEAAYMKSLKDGVDVSTEQLKLARNKKAAGYADNSDVFLAQVDLNQKNQQVAQEETLIRQSKNDLNQLLSWPIDSDYNVVDSIVVSPLLYDNIRQSLMQNPFYLSAVHGVRASEWSEREINSQRFPALRLNAGYNFNYNKSTAGFILYNQNYGPFAAVSLGVPIFNGGIYSKEYQASKINAETSLLQQNQLSDQLQQSLQNSWKSYESNLQLIDTALISVQISKQNLDLVLKQYSLNAATIVDLRLAEEVYIDARFNLYDLLYDAKLAELQLKNLANTL